MSKHVKNKKLANPQAQSKICRLFIGVPSTGVWVSDFGMSLVQLALAFNKYSVPGYTEQSLHVCSTKGSILPKSRWSMLREAIDMGCTHLLFIDSDHSFPRSLAHRLLHHNKEVVACNLATKCIPTQPTARTYNPAEKYGMLLPTLPESKGLEKVWRIGTGIMLIKLSIFARVDTKHLFDIVWKEENNDYQGEDWTMAAAFEKAGVEMYIDHDLSKECGHWGNFNYTHDYSYAFMQPSIPKAEVSYG